VINIDRGWHTASVLVEMLSQTWPECWWRCSPKPGQNGPSTTATHIIIHQNFVSDSVVDESQLKIPYRVHQPQTTKQASNGWGRG